MAVTAREVGEGVSPDLRSSLKVGAELSVQWENHFPKGGSVGPGSIVLKCSTGGSLVGEGTILPLAGLA